MTIPALVVVFVVLVAAGAALKGYGWWLRTRVLRALPADGQLRSVRGVTLRVLVRGTRVLPGMSTRRANRTTGDLALTASRFVVTSNRGVLLDLGPGHGRRLTSIRCTGPGKLVIEGDVPRPGATAAPFRIEAFLPDAVAWAEALQGYTTAPVDGPAFAVTPPWAAPDHNMAGPSR